MKNQIENFPQRIKDKMLEHQVAQGNERDITVFEKDKESSADNGGFDWWDTKECKMDQNFWWIVIHNENFAHFNTIYPEERPDGLLLFPEPKEMMVWMKDESKKVPRVVIGTKNGQFIAWNAATTMEESKGSNGAMGWRFAEEIKKEICISLK